MITALVPRPILRQPGPTSATGATEEQLALRKKMTEQLIIEESKHEALEEMYLWPAVREHLESGNTLADEATGQEQAAKQVLNDLDKLRADDADFEKLLGTFFTDAREHIEFEESQVWPLLRTALTAEAADELGTKIAEGKKTAPTRPHPHTPPRRARSDRRAGRGRGGQGATRSPAGATDGPGHLRMPAPGPGGGHAGRWFRGDSSYAQTGTGGR